MKNPHKKRAERKRKQRREEPAITGHYFHAKYSAALPERADFVKRRLDLLNEVFRILFSDENFVTLLRAESISTIPAYFGPLLEEEKRAHEIA